MASLVTCAVTSLSWCFCTACASLLGACFGNDKASTIPPSITSGRKRSVFLLILALAIALAFQYGIAPWLVDNQDYTGFISDNWLDGCTKYQEISLQESCAGNSGVYRVTGSATLFFLLAAIAVLLKPTANREAWPAKYVLFCFLCGLTIFIPNEPLFDAVYLNIARIGGILFVMFQQLVIVDMCYDWNDSWVARADAAEAEERGAGRKWLAAILVSCFIMFAGAIVGISLLFVHFYGCTSNDAFIIVTLIMAVLITVAQLSGEEGSLLASSAVSLWAVFLCYTAVSKNPDGECNPNLGEVDRLGIALGLIVTIIGMCWTGWSWTAEDKLANKNDDDDDALEAPLAEENGAAAVNDEQRKVSGVVVTGGTSYGAAGANGDTTPAAVDDDDDDDEAAEAAKNDPRRLSNSWKLNIILAAISCWMAMALTSWGEIAADGNAANPQVGRVGMWIVISSQWLALSLYLWTLVAPRLFPNRDFS